MHTIDLCSSNLEKSVPAQHRSILEDENVGNIVAIDAKDRGIL